MTTTVFTIGHSTHPIDEFIGLLQAHNIEVLIDIRTIPRSRHNPQFEQSALAESLKNRGIDYLYMKDLGGLRHPAQDSRNRGWRNESFRGYADYMQTQNFRAGVSALIELAEQKRPAIMCAEAVPWRCHRSLVSDMLIVKGLTVLDIMPDGKLATHTLNPMAHVEGEQITYPPETMQRPGL